ncbi:MAG: polyphosphate kinase 2 family protein [bacterium]|nr:polyphosphate kinase 2 family protein [bacterium]
MPDSHRIIPGRPLELSRLATRAEKFHDDRDEAEREFRKLRKQLADYQFRLYSEGKQKLLVMLQAMDAGGKDSTIRRVFQGVNPQGVQVTSFKAPSKRELAHDYLWRVHRAVPGKGMIGLFNRSHYEDVLIVRVDSLVPEPVWRRRYEQINQFEELLAATGTVILKFYLHISKVEQKQRMEDRLSDPTRHWKFSRGDLDKRRQWNEYMAAYQEALTLCSTEHAPWYAIPADQKWYRNLAIARVLVSTLERMDPQYPEAEAGLDEIEVI